MTFSELLCFTKEQKKLNTTEYQIYSNRSQINIKRNDINVCNVVFMENEAHVYRCPRNGYCDYSNPVVYKMNEEVPAWCGARYLVS